MRTKSVIMVESSFSGHLFHRAIRQLGFVPILLSSNAGRYRHLDTEGLVAVTTDTRNIDAVLETCIALSQTYEILGLLTSSSAYADIAATACRSLGLSGPEPEAISMCLNKFEQRDRIKAAGLTSPAYLFTIDPDAAVRFAERVGLPVILKPAVGAGSMGVRLCEDLPQVAAQAVHILNSSEFATSPGVLVEEYIIGPEFSVETIGDTVIGITKKYLGDPPYFVEIGHDFPADLDPHATAAIVETVKHAIRSLDLLWGPAHTELRFGPAGPTIIEVNPRMAGELIPQLVSLAYGIDPVLETVKLAVGLPVTLSGTRNRAAGIRFVNPEKDGFLHWHSDVHLAKNLEGVTDVEVYRGDGPRIRLGDFRDRLAHVIAVTPTILQTQATLEKAIAALEAKITTSPNGGTD